MEAAKNPEVLDSIAVAVLRRDLEMWLSAKIPNALDWVRRLLLQPAKGAALSVLQSAGLWHRVEETSNRLQRMHDGRCVILQVAVDWMTSSEHMRYLLHLWEDPSYDVTNHIFWRRSAVEFLPGLLASGAEPSQHAHALYCLAEQAVQVHDALFMEAWAQMSHYLVVEEEWTAGPISPNAPEGIPQKHWWWWLQRNRAEHAQEDA